MRGMSSGRERSGWCSLVRHFQQPLAANRLTTDAG
jgi:hypothetical protein